MIMKSNARVIKEMEYGSELCGDSFRGENPYGSCAPFICLNFRLR